MGEKGVVWGGGGGGRGWEVRYIQQEHRSRACSTLPNDVCVPCDMKHMYITCASQYIAPLDWHASTDTGTTHTHTHTWKSKANPSPHTYTHRVCSLIVPPVYGGQPRVQCHAGPSQRCRCPRQGIIGVPYQAGGVPLHEKAPILAVPRPLVVEEACLVRPLTVGACIMRTAAAPVRLPHLLRCSRQRCNHESVIALRVIVQRGADDGRTNGQAGRQ